MSGLDLLRGLFLHSAGDPKLGSLVAVLQVDGDGRVQREALRIYVEQLGIKQRLNIPGKVIQSQASQIPCLIITSGTVHRIVLLFPEAPDRRGCRICRIAEGQTSALLSC